MKTSNQLTVVLNYLPNEVYTEKVLIDRINALKRHITLPFTLEIASTDPKYNTLPSINSAWYSYWYKLNIFSLTGFTIYFDLDVAILGNLDEYLLTLQDTNGIYMRSPCTPLERKYRDYSSSVMIWNGDYSYLAHEFTTEDFGYRGDQAYITEKLKQHQVIIKPLERVFPIEEFRWNYLTSFECLPRVLNTFGDHTFRMMGEPYFNNH